MLRETRDIQNVTINPKDLKALKKREGKYKILYATVKDKKGKNKDIDVLMPLTEMSRASLLLQRIGISDQAPQPQKTLGKAREEQVKNVDRSAPNSRDTKSKSTSSRQASTSPKAPQMMNNQKPSVEAQLEGYRQQQNATRGPTKTQRKRRGASVVEINQRL